MMIRFFLISFLSCYVLFAAKPSDAEKAVMEALGDQKPTLIRLWPKGSQHNEPSGTDPERAEGVGNKIKYHNINSPSLMVYSPPKGIVNNGLGFVFCPGGAYKVMSMFPPSQMVEWLNSLGATVAILKYHVPAAKGDSSHVIPLRDAQRAISVLRSRADEFGLDKNKIGIAGSSAGGHLAFNTTLSHESRAYEKVDALDDVSCRPDVTFLFYPAYLGTDMKVSQKLNFEALNKKTTPPIFISVASDDKFVRGSFAAMVKIKEAKVPCEFHVCHLGGHGGMFGKYPMLEYARTGIRFLNRHGFVDSDTISKSDTWLDKKKSEVIDKYRKVSEKDSSYSVNPPKALAKSSYTLFEKSVEKLMGDSGAVYRLWPGDGTREDDPFKKDVENLFERSVKVAKDITKPSLAFFPADKPNGMSVLVLPGGGYSVLAYDHEGTQVVEWLNKQGISAFLVKYRTPRRDKLDKHHVALQDAQRALRLVRSQADQFGLDPNKIGTLGFSAGGHLALLTGKDFEKASYEKVDSHDDVSFLADFNILIYPAYTTTEMFSDKLDVNLMRSKKEKTVPTFIATALDDKFTHGMFYLMDELYLKKTKIEVHVYENGGHGKGILDTAFSFSQWPRECARWLDDLYNWK